MTDNPIRVLAADDHPIMRQGIAAVVAAESDMVLVAEAEDGLDAIEQCRRHQPHVVLMDVRMPRMDGIQATGTLRTEFPDIRVMMLATHEGDMQARLAMRAGASAYLLKSAVRRELVRAIRDLRYASVERRAVVLRQCDAVNDDSILTMREISVLEGVAGGHSNARVAAHLNVGEETVKSHLKTIFGKLNARDRTHAVVIGYRRGIIPPPAWP